MKQTAVTKQKTLDVIMNLTGLVQHLMRNSQKYGPLKFVLDSWLADAGIDEQGNIVNESGNTIVF